MDSRIVKVDLFYCYLPRPLFVGGLYVERHKGTMKYLRLSYRLVAMP
jgi:hypothetical protein